jgi:hypothetical protein
MPLSNLPLINSSKSGTCHYKQLSERMGGGGEAEQREPVAVT